LIGQAVSILRGGGRNIVLSQMELIVTECGIILHTELFHSTLMLSVVCLALTFVNVWHCILLYFSLFYHLFYRITVIGWSALAVVSRSDIIISARCTLVQSAVLRLHVVCFSVRLSVTLVDCDL